MKANTVDMVYMTSALFFRKTKTTLNTTSSKTPKVSIIALHLKQLFGMQKVQLLQSAIKIPLKIAALLKNELQ